MKASVCKCIQEARRIVALEYQGRKKPFQDRRKNSKIVQDTSAFFILLWFKKQ
jgi:hypothetical protein